jgi:hypothetical protein
MHLVLQSTKLVHPAKRCDVLWMLKACVCLSVQHAQP